jgi:hypothetical protein
VDSKQLQRVEVKSGDKGQVSAVFATFNVIDSDGDVTVPGAFKNGAEVVISSYQHKTWQGALPVGTGRIRTTKSEAILDGQFFMDTQAGRETFSVVKQLGGRQQWSYGYEAIQAEPGKFGGRDVRFLKRLEVPEVSPVLVGAGVNTRTLAAKARKDGGGVLTEEEARRNVSVTEYAAAIRPHETPVSAKQWDFVAAETGDVGLTVDQLRATHAWVDPDADPELKASYGFAHHETDGKANLRACMAGVGALNGLKGQDLGDAQRLAAYSHLAAHLDDGDIEPPELRSGSGMLKQNDELAQILADLAAGRARAWETRRNRALKGKGLNAGTVLILEWIHDEMRALKSLLDSPQEDADREFARFVASQLRHSGATE